MYRCAFRHFNDVLMSGDNMGYLLEKYQIFSVEPEFLKGPMHLIIQMCYPKDGVILVPISLCKRSLN